MHTRVEKKFIEGKQKPKAFASWPLGERVSEYAAAIDDSDVEW
jgi:hypothetical protein